MRGGRKDIWKMGRPLMEDIEKRITLLMGDGKGLCKKFCLYVSQQYGGYSLKEIGAYYGMRGSAVRASPIDELRRRLIEIEG